MSQGTVKGVVGNIRAAFFSKKEKGHDMGAGGIEMAAAVTGEGGTAAGPSIVVLRFRRAIDPLLDVREDLRIPGAEVALGEWNSAIAEIPGVGMGGSFACPITDNFEILVLARGEEEEHSNPAQAFG